MPQRLPAPWLQSTDPTQARRARERLVRSPARLHALCSTFIGAPPPSAICPEGQVKIFFRSVISGVPRNASLKNEAVNDKSRIALRCPDRSVILDAEYRASVGLLKREMGRGG